MDIEYEQSCKWDYLQIHDILTGVSTKLCGKLLQYSPTGRPLCIHTMSSSLNLLFSSDKLIAATGFALTYDIHGNYIPSGHKCEEYYSLDEIASIPIRY